MRGSGCGGTARGKGMQKQTRCNSHLVGGYNLGEVAGCEQVISTEQASLCVPAAITKQQRLGVLETAEIYFP